MGYLLAEDGSVLLAEDGSYLLDEAGQPPFASQPQLPLDLQCDLQLGGAWTGVSPYVYQRDGTQPPVTVTRGRPDETQQAVPSTCSWQWNNRDGRFSPLNPLSPYYGQLKRNTPVRFSVPATSNYLRLEAGSSDCAAAADNAALHVTGSLEARWHGRLSDWRGCFLLGRHDSVSTGSWGLILRNDGTLRFFWYDSGNVEHQTVSDVPLPYQPGDFALKVTLDATTSTVWYYTAPSIDGTYTQLGDGLTFGGTTTVRAGSDPFRAGWSPGNFSDIGTGTAAQMYGRLYEARLYSGIGGTLAADGLFSGQAAGAVSWTGADGLSWSVSGGGEISGRDYRYHGLMSSQPPRWDVTGNDQYVAAKAGGPLRVMTQGSAPPVRSPMYRAVLAQTGTAAPVAYWPMEDGNAATSFGSATGGTPMTWGGGPPTLASSTAFACSAPLPVMGTGSSGAGLQGIVPAYTTGGGAAWSVRFTLDVGTLPASGEPTICQVDCIGGIAAYVVLAANSSGAVQLVAFDNALNVLADTGLVAWTGGIQQPYLWTVQAQQSGSNVQFLAGSVSPGASTGPFITATTSATGIPGYVAQVLPVTGGGYPDTVLGHVQVQPALVSIFALGDALNAHDGETAAARYARLAAENGWPVRVKGSPAYSAAMGQQPVDTLPNLLQACETADRGQQYEPREAAGVGYRTLASMCNQSPVIALSCTSSQPGGVSGGTDSGLDPDYDDLLVRNDWTLTRSAASGAQGGTYRAALNDGSAMSVTGLADYGDSKTVCVQADSQLPGLANWMVHVGTVDEHRWPVIPVNLARTEMASLQAAAMQADAGDLLEVDSVPNTVLYDPVRQVALGFTEKLGGFHWTMEYQCAPGSPYSTVVLDDPVLGRLDTDGSSLASPAAAGATTLSVATAGSNPVWTTAAADFPFDVAIAGERVTVTNITGSSSPQSFTVTRAVNGVSKAQSSGADVRLWTPTILALT